MKKIIAKIVLWLIIISFVSAFVYYLIIDPIKRLGWLGLSFPILLFLVCFLFIKLLDWVFKNI